MVIFKIYYYIEVVFIYELSSYRDVFIHEYLYIEFVFIYQLSVFRCGLYIRVFLYRDGLYIINS